MKKWITILFLFGVAYGQDLRIPVSDSMVYDFTGVTRKGSPGLYKYFTFNTSDDGRITRNVADFNRDSLGGKGWKGMINLQREYTLKTDSAIVFYDPSGSVDTFDIFIFDKDNAPKWDTIINTEDYTPTYRIISCGTCSGSPVTTVLTSPAGRKVQFILVRVHRTDLFSGLWPDIRAITFRGTLTGDADTTYNLAHWAMQTWVPRKISDIVGNFNLQNQQDTLWSDTALVDYGYMRNFDSQNFFDNENVAHGSQRIDLGGGGFTAYQYNAAMARDGHYQYAAVFGNTAFFDAQLVTAGHSVSKGWNTNTITDDPQLPASYSRKGYYMHGLAKIGGTCTGCPSVRTYNGTLVENQGYLKILGTSNEPTLFAFANAWKTPIEVAAEAIGVYDSVKVGDPNILVFVAGYEAYNYDDAKATVMLQKLYLRSRNLKMDGVDFHTISTLKTDSFPYIPTSNQQIGNYGVSPGYWDDWRKNIHFINGLLRESGNVSLKVSIGEDTYQKGYYKRYPIDVGETFSVSQLAAPGYTVATVALDRLNSHAVGALQKDFVVSASGLYQHYWYTAVDEVVLTDNPGFDAIDGSNGKFRRPASFGPPPTSHPADLASSSRRRRIGNYVFSDTITAISRGLHVFKYRHVSIPDSLGFEYAILDSVGTTTVNLNSIIGTVSGTVVTPSLTSRTATEASGMSNALPADPMPRFFIVYSPSGNLPPVADAGTDQGITLPTSSVTLNGSASDDPDGTITTYLWTKTSGPATYNIVSPSSATTTANTLVAGTYVFTLTVTDNLGAQHADNVTITVNPVPPLGAPIKIRLRVNNN